MIGWHRYLLPDAYLLVHDAFSSIGVTKAVLRHMTPSDTLEPSSIRDRPGSLVCFRLKDVTVSSRPQLVARLGFFARNILVKLTLRRGLV